MEEEALPAALQELEARLQSLPADSEAMLLSELDGYVTGLALCPETIPPDEWLPVVWGVDEHEEPEDRSERAALAAMVMAHYEAVAGELRTGGYKYAPVYNVDERNDDILWEIWASGFERAMALRPESWSAVIEGDDEDAALALAALITLADVANGVQADEEDEEAAKFRESLVRDAPDAILACVLNLCDWRRSRIEKSARRPVVRGIKVGRNDPCPCGSGKKYKKCCGLL